MKSLNSISLLLALWGALTGCGDGSDGRIEASGTLEATEVRVSAMVPGQIQRIFIREGVDVQAGDTLMVLDQTTLALQWRQARGGVDLAEAQYKLLLNGARPEDLQLAEEALKSAESSFKSANDDYARMKELYAAQSVSRKQFDDAESRFTIAQAQLNSAKQQVQKMQQFARAEDLAAAKARLEQAQAWAGILHKQLDDATILAPVAGTVTHRPVEEGELVGVGTTVATVARLETLNLVIYVNEVDLAKVQVGGGADIVIDAHPDRTFPGKVVYISPLAEFTPKNVQTKEDRTKLVFGVKIEVENGERILKSGMPADAWIR